jgi:hypothetical protein
MDKTTQRQVKHQRPVAGRKMKVQKKQGRTVRHDRTTHTHALMRHD